MYRPNRITRLAVLAVAGSFAVSACGSSDSESSSGGSSDSGSSSEKKGTQLYFVDGNTADYAKDFDPGTLQGVKATYPGAELGDAFRERLLGVNPKLKDFTYGPESYDATNIIALAAIQAGDDSGEAIGAEIINVTKDGTACTSFEECAKLLEDGEDIDYQGPSGPTDMTETGSLIAGTYGVQEYKKGNTYEQIDSISGVVPPTE